MAYNPGLEIGQVLRNSEIVDRFQCGNMGGMRRSHATNTLVIVSDYTKGIYHDKWIGGVLHYTGMGKSGDQDIHWAQNATLAESNHNGVDVHLFEVIDPGEYIYCGRVRLVDKPYIEIQPDENGKSRKVWMFPIRPVPDNDVKKPRMYVFADMEDYKARGKNVDQEYARALASGIKSGNEIKQLVTSDANRVKERPEIAIPQGIVGKRIQHCVFGTGTVIGVKGTLIEVSFDKAGEKKIGYAFCIKNNMIEMI